MLSTQQIYQMTKSALPNMTVRSFSRYCGKSDGYYGSLCAQNMELSTNALIHLSETLTYRRSMSASTKLDQLLEVIASEIAQRMCHVESSNLAVRRMIIKAVAEVQMAKDTDVSGPLPIVIG
jgi:hypothetical protein